MDEQSLPDSGFLVLALLAEGETHGYEIQRLVHNRGFRFWTRLQRSSIYNALSLLEKEGLISVHMTAGEGPDRKVYRITKSGEARLRMEGMRHLSDPAHPRSEIDLGIYALPFLPKAQATKAFTECLGHLRARRAFLEERLEWCRARKLRIPALAFERPLLVLDAEIAWVERVARTYSRDGASGEEWAHYVYREPPAADVRRVSGNERGRKTK
jgi:DNA-binding PadR family transcriptional regulator